LEWRNWTELGGNLKAASTPSVAGVFQRELTMVARLPNGRVGVVARSTAGWFTWQDLGFACRDRPAVAIHSGRFILAARGTDDGLWIGGFQQWTASGGSLTSAPSIAAWRMDGNAEIFARGADGTLQWFTFKNYGAATLNPSPGSQRVAGAPAAVAPGPNGIHVIARREGDSHLIHTVWNYQSWSTWSDLGEVTTSSPCVVSRDINSLEIYFADTGGALARRRFTVGSNGGLVSSGPREVLAPVVLGDPAATSFGLWHVEVFHRESDGRLTRVYAEGVRTADDVGIELLDDQRVDSAPALWGEARDVVVCVARNANDQLVTTVAEDGYWGEWTNLGGFLDSDPVVVTRLATTFEVVARGSDQQLMRWTRLGPSWTGPVSLPPPASGWCVGQPRVFADWQGGLRIVTRVNSNRLNEAVIGPNGVFQRWNDLSGEVSTQAPEIVHVNQNALPAPYPGMTPSVAMEAGTWVVVPNAAGLLRGRLFSGGAWGPWRWFSTRVTPVRRPFPVSRDVGTALAYVDDRIAATKQAGWIGRAPDGRFLQQRMVWVRKVGASVVAVVLESTDWVASPTWIELAADPTGTQFPESLGSTPGGPAVDVTHLFARSPQGHLRWLPLGEPAPGPLSWQLVAPNLRVAGDVAPLTQWARYENQHILIAAVVTTGRSLLIGVGGIGPAPQRVRPQATNHTLPLPPRPVRPVRPVRPIFPPPSP